MFSHNEITDYCSYSKDTIKTKHDEMLKYIYTIILKNQLVNKTDQLYQLYTYFNQCSSNRDYWSKLKNLISAYNLLLQLPELNVKQLFQIHHWLVESPNGNNGYINLTNKNNICNYDLVVSRDGINWIGIDVKCATRHYVMSKKHNQLYIEQSGFAHKKFNDLLNVYKQRYEEEHPGRKVVKSIMVIGLMDFFYQDKYLSTLKYNKHLVKDELIKIDPRVVQDNNYVFRVLDLDKYCSKDNNSLYTLSCGDIHKYYRNGKEEVNLTIPVNNEITPALLDFII